MRAGAIVKIALALNLYHNSRIREAGSSGPSGPAATGRAGTHWLEC